ncbi:Crp/Fnr family transcriptional regulator, partial [Robertmurraya massiliosenegalensis]
SHNPTDIIMGVFIAAAGYNAGKYGLDRYVLPYLRKLVTKGKNEASQSVSA